MAINLGNNDITLKVDSTDVSAVYLGSTLVYSGGSQPTPTLQWVEFNSGDDISGLDVYGVSGNAYDLSTTFNGGGLEIAFDFSRNRVECNISTCYNNTYATSDNVELVFSNVGCSDYYSPSPVTTAASTFKLLIYQ